MKKYVAMLLSILFLLSGCSHSTAYEKPASFYYCSATFQYESGDSAIFHSKLASCHNYSAILVISTLV